MTALKPSCGEHCEGDRLMVVEVEGDRLMVVEVEGDRLRGGGVRQAEGGGGETG